MIDPELLKILCCPETHQPVALADAALIEKLNRRLAAGELQNRGGKIVRDKLDAGLIREDRQVLYPIRSSIPIMLVEESIRVGI